MCGIIGIVLHPDSASHPTHKKPDYHQLPSLLKKSLSHIQHRGYDGAGIALVTTEKIITHKDYGLIKEVLTDEKIHEFLSTTDLPLSGYGLAHTRYKTVGECSPRASQPLTNSNQTLCLVHNGQIEANNCLPDSGYLLNLWNRYFQRANYHGQAAMIDNLIKQIVTEIFKTVRGSYSCLMMIQGYGLVAFRDPQGIRPLLVGKSPRGDYYLASEDIAFADFQIKEIYDLPPGSCLIIRKGTSFVTPEATLSQLMPRPEARLRPCIFEYIYLAHHESILNEFSVKKAREILGRTLANRIQREYADLDIDYVIPIPETSCYAAQVLANSLDVEYLPLLTLNPNRKQPRSFILPTQELREKAVANKFILDQNCDFKGKNLLLVDDSIVRGTTLRHLVRVIRKKYPGIYEIYVASIAPPIVNRNIYGIDIPNTKLLLAYQRDLEEIQDILEVDLVIYQDLEEIEANFTDFSGIHRFEDSMFLKN